MKSIKIAIEGELYLVTEKNPRSELYQLYYFGDDSTHLVGRSSKSDDLLYIQKSPFSELLCTERIAAVIEEFIHRKKTILVSVN